MMEKNESIQEGRPAPDFELKDQNGVSVQLSGFKGKSVVLYFYPKDDTPGCTKEACSFRDNLKRIESSGAVILGVSLDNEASHRKFIAKYGLNFTLLCDEDSKVARLYGVYKKKSIFEKLFWGIERSTFVIDPKGNLKKIFKKVKVDGHTEEVLNALHATQRSQD